MNTTRRKFLQLGSLLMVASILDAENAYATSSTSENLHLPEKNLRFLFQGDSITDGNRGRNNDPNHIMGHGYANLIASRIAADFPKNAFSFFNRGISGNKVPDLQARWQTDTLDLKPDVLSLLVGINDVGAMVNKPESAKTTEQFESGYRDLLQQVRTLNNNTLLVLGLPFVYPLGNVKAKFDIWKPEVERRKLVVKKLASEFDAVLVDFPSVFEKAFKDRAAEYWVWDGVHPTIAGHELMAREWIRQVAKRLFFLKKYGY
ncbi:SGNH/GDSL hydrolase family protein [Desertivirga xinjiangensis]|uniref:SGNH/GDSL hydrolase family protein n=1 Tax=Desertivirga xinjiangensis TaxID=539206 RepID=UPI00210F11DD|nr:SGNH/GDSL hydrolase family protein [Pedobacter xinjiangensis]